MSFSERTRFSKLEIIPRSLVRFKVRWRPTSSPDRQSMICKDFRASPLTQPFSSSASSSRIALGKSIFCARPWRTITSLSLASLLINASSQELLVATAILAPLLGSCARFRKKSVGLLGFSATRIRILSQKCSANTLSFSERVCVEPAIIYCLMSSPFKILSASEMPTPEIGYQRCLFIEVILCWAAVFHDHPII